MLTQPQERALRRLLLSGGRLSLPGRDGPVRIKVERAAPETGLDIARADVTQGSRELFRYSNWEARELYPELAAGLDQLTPDTYAASEVRHG